MFASRPALRIKKLVRPLSAWLGFSGLYALAGGACPCCGQFACPNGLLGAGLVGGFLSAGLHLWRRFRERRPALDSTKKGRL